MLRATKVYYCGECDIGYSKEQFTNHLIRHLSHKKTLIIFDSGPEFNYFRELQLREKAKDILSFEVKPVLKVFHNPVSEQTYVTWLGHGYRKGDKLFFSYEPDFLVTTRNCGQILIIDVKGKSKRLSKKTGKFWTSETAVFRLKKKILKGLKYEVIVK